MIQNDAQLHQAQADIQKLWRFLESARQTHGSVDYERLAAPYLLQIQELSKKCWIIYQRSQNPPTHDLSRLTLDASRISVTSHELEATPHPSPLPPHAQKTLVRSGLYR
jgi:hypothetical protein